MLVSPTVHFFAVGLLSLILLVIILFLFVSARARAYWTSPPKLPPPKTFRALIRALIRVIFVNLSPLPPKGVGALILGLLGLFAVTYFYEYPLAAYIVDDSGHRKRLLYGNSFDFTFANGSRSHSTVQGNIIINNTSRPVFLLSIDYHSTSRKTEIEKQEEPTLSNNQTGKDNHAAELKRLEELFYNPPIKQEFPPYTVFASSDHIDYWGPTPPPYITYVRGHSMAGNRRQFWLKYK